MRNLYHRGCAEGAADNQRDGTRPDAEKLLQGQHRFPDTLHPGDLNPPLLWISETGRRVEEKMTAQDRLPASKEDLWLQTYEIPRE